MSALPTQVMPVPSRPHTARPKLRVVGQPAVERHGEFEALVPSTPAVRRRFLQAVPTAPSVPSAAEAHILQGERTVYPPVPTYADVEASRLRRANAEAHLIHTHDVQAVREPLTVQDIALRLSIGVAVAAGTVMAGLGLQWWLVL